MTKVYLTGVFVEDLGRHVPIETIEHEGCLWLVPLWSEDPSAGVRYPLRLVRLPAEFLQRTPGGRYDFELQRPITNSVLLDGMNLSGTGISYDVVSEPDISLPLDDDTQDQDT